MKTCARWTIKWLAMPAWLALAACATNHAPPAVTAGKATPQLRSGSNELRTYQVEDWIAPDDRTLIVNAVDRSLFEARFKGKCTGLRLVDTIAFIAPTPPQIDKFEGIVLPDGTRCTFASLTRLVTTPAQTKGTPETNNP
jgi:hypothetical protein